VNCRRFPIWIVIEDGIALPQLGDLSFADFRIHSGEPCIVQGCAETIIRNVRFTNMHIETTGDQAIICRYCEGMKLSNVELCNRPDGGVA